MKKKNWILLFAFSALLSSCSLFKEHCHCPKFGQVEVPAQQHASAQVQQQLR